MTRFKSVVRRVWQIGLSIRDLFPLTGLGILLTAASFYAVRAWAHAQLDLVVLVAGYVGLALAGLAVLMVSLVCLVLKLSAARVFSDGSPMISLETLTPIRTGHSLAALRWLPLVGVRWEWLRPTHCGVDIKKEGSRAHETVLAQERGEFSNICRKVIVEDVMGLARLAFRHTRLTSVHISPSVGALATLPILTAHTGGEDLAHPYGQPEGDRLELRRYNLGDPARLIHWKLYARTRKLMSRKPELAVSTTHRVIGYLITGEFDDASAAAARLAIQHGGLGEEWLFSADGAQTAADTPEAALYLIRQSKQACPDGPTRLQDFVSHHTVREPASLVVFAPPVERSDWVAAVIRVSKQHPGPMRVIIALDGLPGPSHTRSLGRIFVAKPRKAPIESRQFNALLAKLRHAGIDCTVLERQSGRVLHAWELTPRAQKKVA